MRLIYHPLAEGEVIQAALYYDQKVPGLGAEFLEALNLAAAVIKRTPQTWPIAEGDIRRYLMSRFPLTIYYRVLPSYVRVLAVKHHRRHPNYWRARIVD